jgi:hypothetical protein
MKWLGQGITFVGLYVIYSGTFGQPSYRTLGLDWGVAFGYMAVGAVILLVGGAIAKAAMSQEMVDADTTASETFSGTPKGPFSLYLRAFGTSGKFRVESGPTNLFDWDQYDRPGLDVLERIFADAVKATAPLIGLDGRGDAEFGLGTAGLVTEWKDKITRAMAAATYIFVVPASNPGIIWEIGEIKSKGHFAKAIFIMPPTEYPIKYEGEGAYQDTWENARAACLSEHGLSLPEYLATGAVFQIDPTTNAAVRLRGFDGLTPTKVAKTVNAVRLS